MLAVLKNARFARLLAGQTLSFLGDWLNLTAMMSLLAFRWQATAFQLSLFGLVSALPWVVIGPVAGVFADRWNRKTTMIIADLIRAVAVLGLLLVRNVGQAYAVVLLLGVVAPFFTASRAPAIKAIVGDEALLPANALSTMALNLTKVIGPAIGGIIVATAGEYACFWADSLSFVLSALFIATVAIPATSRAAKAAAARPAGPEGAAAHVTVDTAPTGPRTGFLADLKVGLGHVARKPLLAYAVALVALTAFCLGVVDAVAVVFVREVFGTAPRLLGWILAAIGFGTVVSAVWVGSHGKRYNPRLLCVFGVLGMSAPLAVMSFIGVVAPTLPAMVPLTLFLLMLSGLGQSLLTVTTMTIIQTETPGEILGRVSGATDTVTIGSQLIASPIAGAVAMLVGAGPVMLAAGVLLTILGMVFWARMSGGRGLEPGAASAVLAPSVGGLAGVDETAAKID